MPFNSASDAFRVRPDVAYGQSPSTPRDSHADAIAEETRLRDETAAFDASIADLETFAATRGALEDELGEKRALLSQRRVAHAARLEEIRRVRPVTHRSVSTFDRVSFQLTGELFSRGTPDVPPAFARSSLAATSRHHGDIA